MSNSRRLRRKIEQVLPEYAMPGAVLFAHAHPERVVPEMFSLLFYLPWTAVPLMQAALDRSRQLAAEDGVCARLVGYLEKHMVEEMHGDEPGGEMLEDLGALGVDTAALLAHPAPAKIAQLVGTQY